jgi:hypothetical protein
MPVIQTSFPFVFQTFGKAVDRVLLAGAIVGMRNGDGLFSPRDVLSFFDALRVPRPANIHRDLGLLEIENYVRRVGAHWAVTPVGRNVVQEHLQNFNEAELKAYLQGTPGSFLAHERHLVIPPELAPPKWLNAIERLTQKFPFETNVFLMTRFPEDTKDKTYLDPVLPAIPVIRNALKLHGLSLHLASERQLDDDLLGNVAAYMWSCQFGIGILEDRMARGLNYNVMTEIGAMLMTGRRCALLKDKTSPSLPTDIIGLIYKPMDLDNTGSLTEIIHDGLPKTSTLDGVPAVHRNIWKVIMPGLVSAKNCSPQTFLKYLRGPDISYPS